MSTTKRIPTAKQVAAMTPSQHKSLENRLRRAAEHQGLRLERARVRDVYALDYGTYQLVNPRTNTLAWADWINQRGYGLDLHDVAEYLFNRKSEGKRGNR